MKEVLLWVYSYKPPNSDNPVLPGTTRFSVSAFGIPRVYTSNRLVPWQPSVIIGEHPTASKTAALSSTLKRLEDRGLLNRYSVKDKRGNGARETVLVAGKPVQTTHVQLTAEGALFARSLIQDDDLMKHEAQKAHRILVEQLESLRFALELLNREQLRKKVEDDHNPKSLPFLERSNEKLGHLTTSEFVTKVRSASAIIQEVELELQEKLKEMET